MVRQPGEKPTKALWIFCEGTTEKLYFDKYRFEERIGRLKIKSVKTGYTNANGIIQKAINFAKNNRNFQTGDLIACVFDRDANTNNQLEKAKSLAENEGIFLSFSNPCFEYWILCHYGYFPSVYEVNEVIDKIKGFSPDYKKNDPELYSKTCDKLTIAKNNAKRIQKTHEDKNTELISRESNPLSLVFHIIDKINEFK